MTLIERLRDAKALLEREAADEIEQLEALNIELRKQLSEKIAECLRIKSNVQREYDK